MRRERGLWREMLIVLAFITTCALLLHAAGCQHQ